jgi:hypothetical protein
MEKEEKELQIQLAKEERELQIKLAQLQTRIQISLAVVFGELALLAGVVIGLMQVFFATPAEMVLIRQLLLVTAGVSFVSIAFVIEIGIKKMVSTRKELDNLT